MARVSSRWSSVPPVLIRAEDLAEALAQQPPPVVLDVRWRLGAPPGHGEYLTGHVPGAVYVDLDTELSRPGDPTEGRHPMPTAVDLQASMRRWGIDDGDRVVVYDADGNLAAARAWWLLRWAGARDVRILDGALPAWVEAGRSLDMEDVVPVPGSAVVRPDSLPTLTPAQAGAWPRNGMLLDARAEERYRGEHEPVDPRAGHIPGALSLPTALNLSPDGRFKPRAELVDRFAESGIGATTSVAAYCGSGVTAAHMLAALAIAGIDATLYPGSWSQWSHLDLPVEAGAGPASRPGARG